MNMVYPTAGGGGGVSQCLSIYREGDSVYPTTGREIVKVYPTAGREIV